MVEQPGQQPITLVGVVERLLTGAAVAGATIYVLMNALYIEFYDDFGVRPEDVGWDRLAVLGRSAWIALVGISVAGLGGLVYLIIAARNRKRALMLEFEQRPEERRTEEDEERAEELGASREPTVSQAAAAHAERQMREEQFHKRHIDWLLGLAPWALLAFLVLILFGFRILLFQVEDEAESVKRGESVNGVGYFVTFIDVRVSRANVIWLGDKEKQSEKLRSPYMMYLGRGRDVAVLLACASAKGSVPSDVVATDLYTVMVPGDEVAIDLFDVEAEGVEQEPNKEARQRREFEMSCKD